MLLLVNLINHLVISIISVLGYNYNLKIVLLSLRNKVNAFIFNNFSVIVQLQLKKYIIILKNKIKHLFYNR